MVGFTLFDTAVGRCGVAWGPDGIVSVQLPEARDAATRARLLLRHPDAVEGRPPADVQRGIDDITALLRGESRDFADLRLDANARVVEIIYTPTVNAPTANSSDSFAGGKP